MDPARLVKISKYLSKHLRHEPQRLGLELAPGGWVEVEALLGACARQRFPISRAQLDEVVSRSDKQRFAFDETGTRTARRYPGCQESWISCCSFTDHGITVLKSP